ncbi:MAG TPA: dihydroneopterin aldolase [Legionella sp.]|nr:dihydroneopterin aldolase [Legionella sp.]
MKDSLRITALSVSTHIGIHAWEQRILQKLLLDITIPMDLSTCNNALANTIDYDALCQQVTVFIESNAFTLIETVAEQVAQLIKEAFNVTALTVSVSKPHAIQNAGNIRVTVHR